MDTFHTDVSPTILEHFAKNGQEPYAIIIGCSDSRVIPERIFHSAMLNVKQSVNIIESSLEIQKDEEHGLKVVGAVYCIEDGTVEFLA